MSSCLHVSASTSRSVHEAAQLLCKVGWAPRAGRQPFCASWFAAPASPASPSCSSCRAATRRPSLCAAACTRATWRHLSSEQACATPHSTAAGQTACSVPRLPPAYGCQPNLFVLLHTPPLLLHTRSLFPHPPPTLPLPLPLRSHSCQPNLFVQPVLTTHHDTRCCAIALFSMGACAGCVVVASPCAQPVDCWCSQGAVPLPCSPWVRSSACSILNGVPPERLPVLPLLRLCALLSPTHPRALARLPAENIAPLTELTLDYGEAYVAGWPGGCKCSAVNCVSKRPTGLTAEATGADTAEGQQQQQEQGEQEGDGGSGGEGSGDEEEKQAQEQEEDGEDGSDAE